MKKIIALTSALLLATSAHATLITYGDDPTVDRASIDGWAGVFVKATPISAPDAIETYGTIQDWSFFVDGARAGVEVTPLLLSTPLAGDPQTATVVGIGTATSGYNAVGLQSNIPFGLTAGSASFDTTDANYFIGFIQNDPNDPSTRNADGLISYAGSGGDWYAAAENEAQTGVSIGLAMPGTGGNGNPIAGTGRIYSTEFSINFIPEAQTASLFSMGMILLFAARRFRR